MEKQPQGGSQHNEVDQNKIPQKQTIWVLSGAMGNVIHTKAELVNKAAELQRVLYE